MRFLLGFGSFSNDRMPGRGGGSEAPGTARGFPARFGWSGWCDKLGINGGQPTSDVGERRPSGAGIPRSPAGGDLRLGHHQQRQRGTDQIGPALEAFWGTQVGGGPAQLLLEKAMAVFLAKTAAIRGHHLVEREQRGAPSQEPTHAGIAFGIGRLMAGHPVDGKGEVACCLEVQVVPGGDLDRAIVGDPGRIRGVLGGSSFGPQRGPILGRMAPLASGGRSRAIRDAIVAQPQEHINLQVGDRLEEGGIAKFAISLEQRAFLEERDHLSQRGGTGVDRFHGTGDAGQVQGIGACGGHGGQDAYPDKCPVGQDGGSPGRRIGHMGQRPIGQRGGGGPMHRRDVQPQTQPRSGRGGRPMRTQHLAQPRPINVPPR